MMIDLRSDTVTKPTAAMLNAMMQAPVGDDVLGDDPSVISLQEKTAAILGQEASLFVPSGTMANQIAIRLHSRPGQWVIAEQDTHCYHYESGAAAALAGVQFRFVAQHHHMAASALPFRNHGPDLQSTALVILENTHNRLGGRAYGVDVVIKLCAAAQKHGVKTHCDGARVWHAATAENTDVKNLTTHFDSVAACFSKGLGAPIGSILAGNRDFIRAAKVLRRQQGGAMRQAGYLAAAAEFGLNHHRQRLQEDHRHAKQLRTFLVEMATADYPIEVDIPAVPTNLVYFRIVKEPEKFMGLLTKQGVRVVYLGEGLFRAVTHLGISSQQISACLRRFEKSFDQLQAKS